MLLGNPCFKKKNQLTQLDTGSVSFKYHKNAVDFLNCKVDKYKNSLPYSSVIRNETIINFQTEP